MLVAVLAVLSARWAYQTANRLDRLHVRYDLSWQALDGALARRAVVARAVAIDAYGGAPKGRRLAALADAAERAPRPAREAAENELSAALALVDPASLPAGLVAELADAEARVLLARRFHNDAVRDTLALRERPLVRLLRLGGTAALPSYFEIVERPHALAHGALGSRRPQPPHVGAGGAARRDRRGAAAVRVGSRASLRGTAPRWWFTVGGGCSQGSGWPRPPRGSWPRRPVCGSSRRDMVGPVWRRDAVFEFNGSVIDSEEIFFVYRTRRFEPSRAGRTELERRYIHGHRWCDAADIAAAGRGGRDGVSRCSCPELLAEAAALAGGAAAPGRLQSIR